jgi:hypothetical protein
MKAINFAHISLLATFLFIGTAAFSQNTSVTNSKKQNSTEMKTYIIERDIPNAGQLTAEQLKDISKASCAVLKDMGPKIQWLHSYVSGNKFYCVYKAENEDLIREHAKKGGFPCNKIIEVATTISPATAN